MSGVFAHPWKGGLFADPEIADALSPEAELAAMLRVEAAHARPLGSEPAAIAIEAVRVMPQDLRAGMGSDGVPVPALVRALKEQILPDLHPFVHKGLTSQDVVDTAQALLLSNVNALFERRISNLEMAFSDLIEREGSALLMGRTRMQAALAITVADRVETWRMPLDGLLTRLNGIAPMLTVLSAGGPVGLGLPKAHCQTMGQALGLSVPVKAPHAMRQALADYASWLSLVTGSLGKMGQDVALMAQQGIDELSLKDGGGSSAMPHKQNPVLAELLVTLAHFNATQVSAMHQALVHEQERSGAAWSLEWMILPQMVQATGRALTAARTLLDSIDRIGSS